MPHNGIKDKFSVIEKILEQLLIKLGNIEIQ